MNIINAASIIILNKNSEILLQKKDLTYKRSPGRWALFGGGINQKESPAKALKRELLEETGIYFTKSRLFKVYDYKEKEREGKLYIFSAILSKPISSIRLTEGAGFAFFGKKELSKLGIIKIDSRIIKEYFKFFK